MNFGAAGTFRWDLSLTCRKIFSQAWTSRKMRVTWKMPAILQQEMTMRTQINHDGWGHHENWEKLPGWVMLTLCFTYLSIIFYLHLINKPSFRRERSLWMSVAKLSLKSTAKWWIAWSKKPGLKQPSLNWKHRDGKKERLGPKSWYLKSRVVFL